MTKNRLPDKIRDIPRVAGRILGSERFFYLIILLIAAQGVWFALTYMPGLFDEGFHFRFIDSYTDNISPFLTSQPQELDYLGETTRNANYLYYFIMSWPLRVVKLLSDSYFVQVFALRMIHLGIFLGAVFMYRRLLTRIGAGKPLAHLALLATVLLPVFATLVSVITYDTPVFFLFPLSLLLLFEVLGSNKILITRIGQLLAVVLLASLIKVSFLPFTVGILIYLVAGLLVKHGKKLVPGIWRELKTKSIFSATLLVLAVLIPVLLFIERPLQNLVRFKSPSASCVELIDESRCAQNYTAARDIEFKNIKRNGFLPYEPVEYLFTYWIMGSLRTEIRVMPSANMFFLFKSVMYGLSFIGALLILIYLRDFLSHPRMRDTVVISGIYVLVLFLENYRAYLALGQPVAISSRYLLPVIPLAIYLALNAYKRAVGQRFPGLSTLGLVGILLIMLTQGGSVTTHMLTVPDYRWDKGPAASFNRKLDTVMRKIVVERPIP